ncbi:MAG: DNA-3-methyladenine glycosylase [bacterium]
MSSAFRDRERADAASAARAALSGRGSDVAALLLGAEVTSDVGPQVAVRLTEVEAYEGRDDPASHAFRGRTARNAVMFGPAGHLYVYFVYGMYFCANVVCGRPGEATAVLLRAGVVVEGALVARARRPTARREVDLARGPAGLTRSLGLTRDVNGVDLLDPASPVRLTLPAQPVPPAGLERGPRVGVSTARTAPLRFWIRDDPTVSKYRAAVRRPPSAGRKAARSTGRDGQTDRP